MKKFITVLMLALCTAFLAKAQEEMVLLSGETDDPEPIVYYNFVDWSIDEGRIAQWYIDFGDEEFTTWVDNPEPDGINTTSTSLMAQTFKEDIPTVDWWGNFLNFVLDEPIEITEANRYMHIFHYRENLNNIWAVFLNTNGSHEDAELGNLRFQGNNNVPGRWEDIVIDLHYLMDNDIPLEQFNFLVDAAWSDPRDSPPTRYYWDEIVLNDDPFPRGVEFLDGTDLLNFDDQEQMDNLTITTQNEANTFEVVPNPLPDSWVNPNGMVGKFHKSDEASWWQGLHIQFPGLHMIEYGEKQYLHVFVKTDSTCFMQLHVIDQNDVHHTQMFFYPHDDLDGEWFDLVWDLSDYTAIKAITVRFDLQLDDEDNYINNTPARDFYVDKIVLDDDPFEREGEWDDDDDTFVIEREGTEEGLTAYASDKTIFFSMQEATHVQVFDVTGRNIASERLGHGSDLNMINVERSGLYFIRVTDNQGRMSTAKVLVK